MIHAIYSDIFKTWFLKKKCFFLLFFSQSMLNFGHQGFELHRNCGLYLHQIEPPFHNDN
jgi:hypothetical protein